MKNSNEIIFAPYRVFKKQVCPQCKQKRFVAFLNKSTGEIIKNDSELTGLPGEFTGKCDSASCGYLVHWSPVVNNKKNLNHKKINVSTLSNQIETDIPYWKYVNYLKLKNKSSLIRYLKSVFPNHRQIVESAFSKYQLGSTVWGKTLYPFFKDENTLIAAKVIEYDEDTGKRQNEYTWTAGQVNKENRFINWLPFGYQLIQESLKQGIDTIVIHEGVKNPVVAEIVDKIHGRDRLHIATGSAYYFESLNKVSKEVEQFKNKFVIPDKGFIKLGKKTIRVSDYWKNKIKVKGLQYLDFLDKCESLQNGADYIDYLQFKGLM